MYAYIRELCYLRSASLVVADDREEVGGRGDEAGDGEGVVFVPVGSEAHWAEHHCRARSEQCKQFLYANGSSQGLEHLICATLSELFACCICPRRPQSSLGRSPLPSERGTMSMVINNFSLKMAQFKA